MHDFHFYEANCCAFCVRRFEPRVIRVKEADGTLLHLSCVKPRDEYREAQRQEQTEELFVMPGRRSAREERVLTAA